MDWRVEIEEKAVVIECDGGRWGSTMARWWLLIVLARER